MRTHKPSLRACLPLFEGRARTVGGKSVKLIKKSASKALIFSDLEDII